VRNRLENKFLSEEIPIACALNDRELQERRETILHKVGESLIDCEELPDGFQYRFALEDSLLQDLVNVISLERKCCPFLNFKLNIEAGKDFVSLELTGREGTKEAVQTLFNWSNQSAIST
jgi:hypothetical protein